MGLTSHEKRKGFVGAWKLSSDSLPTFPGSGCWCHADQQDFALVSAQRGLSSPDSFCLTQVPAGASRVAAAVRRAFDRGRRVRTLGVSLGQAEPGMALSPSQAPKTRHCAARDEAAVSWVPARGLTLTKPSSGIASVQRAAPPPRMEHGAPALTPSLPEPEKPSPPTAQSQASPSGSRRRGAVRQCQPGRPQAPCPKSGLHAGATEGARFLGRHFLYWAKQETGWERKIIPRNQQNKRKWQKRQYQEEKKPQKRQQQKKKANPPKPKRSSPSPLLCCTAALPLLPTHKGLQRPFLDSASTLNLLHCIRHPSGPGITHLRDSAATQGHPVTAEEKQPAVGGKKRQILDVYPQ